jgi:predicted MFS family arabinose efflux permease
MLFPAVGCIAFGLLVLAAATSTTHVVVAGVLCGTGHGYAFPITSALAVVRARASERGAAVAAFTALFDLGLLVGGPLLGFVAKASDYETMFATAAGLSLAGLVGFALWDRGRDVSGRPR